MLGDAVHTQFVTQNFKMTFSVQTTHLPLKALGVTKHIFVIKHPTQVPLEKEQL